MILSKCAICGSKKSRFIRKQEAKELLSSLGIKTPFSNIPIPMWIDVKHNSVKCNSVECNSIECNSSKRNSFECNSVECNSVKCNFIKKE